MSNASDVLPIHSLAEAYLYLMITPCAACGQGQLVGDDARAHHDEERRILTIPARCKKCDARRDIWFDTRSIEAGGFQAVSAHTVATINPTQEPSRIIDVGGWITLATVIAESAQKAGSAAEARHLKLEAAQCLDEALLFYDDDNDLPPAEAFFHERTRKQFQRTPEFFSRQRLVSLRARLPIVYTGSASPIEAGDTLPPVKRKRRRRWWWPWGRK